MAARKERSDGMPKSLDAERTILGAILLNTEAYYQAALELRPDDFAFDGHRLVYRAMQDLDGDSKPIDLLTLTEQLMAKKQLEAVGGAAYLASLTEGLPHRDNIESYVDILRDKAKKRSIIHTAQSMLVAAMDDFHPADEIVSKGHERLLEIASTSKRVRAYHVKEFINEMFTKMQEEANQAKEGVLGLTLAIDPIDDATSGMLPGEQIVIGGYSSDGKSLYTKQVILANLLREIPCLVFTQEMTKEQYLRRMIPEITDGALTGKQMRDLRGLDEAGRNLLKFAKERLEKLPLWTVDASTVTATQLTALSRMYTRREKIRLQAMDFIQLIQGDGNEDDNGYGRVTRGSRAMRETAKDNGINSIVVSQITRPQGGKKTPPNMFMLRQSGDIAQDAHIVLLPYRPEGAKGFFTGKDQIRIAKMREGGRGPVAVRLNRQKLKFETRDANANDEDEE